MKIILNNNVELAPINIIGGKRNVQGANRDTLSFVFPAEVSLDEMNDIFSSANCETITIIETSTTIGAEGNEVVMENEYIHNGYTVRAELKREPVMVTPATSVDAAVYENRVTVAMSQRTYEESQLEAMQAAIDMLCMEDVEEA